MSAEPARHPLQPYGTNAQRGRFECVDCGEEYVHASSASLPPCPRYRDLTHPRAAWRALASDDAADGSESEAEGSASEQS